MSNDVRSLFRLRNVLNTEWLNAATSEIYVRDPDDLTWLRLVPNEFSIRNQTNTGWIDIDNTPELDIDDPCKYKSDPTSCSGSPTDDAFGSGDGVGSGGAQFVQATGYPAGYDLADAGWSGFGLERSEVWPTAYSLRRPGLSKSESYDNSPIAADNGDAIYVNPALANTSVFSRGAQISEFYYVLGSVAGYVDVLWVTYGAEMSVDVYYMGERVASSCGKQSGRGRIAFPYDPTPNGGEERIMIRVRTSVATHWAVQVLSPSQRHVTAATDLDLAYYKPYNVAAHRDLLTLDYLGTPVFPAPCHASVYVNAKRLSAKGHFEYYHHVGAVAGYMYLDYSSWGNADFVEVYHYGLRIATTLDPQQGRGYLHFYFDPTKNGCQDIMVRVVGSGQGTGDNTSVYYALWCPDTSGAREARHPCGQYEVFSAGHPTTEDCFDLSTYPNELCGALITVDSGSYTAQFSVYDENDTLLDSVSVQGTATLEFWLPVGQTHKRKIYVQVTSAIGGNWSYFVSCPKQKPVIQVPDYNEQYLCEVPTDATDNFEWTRVAHSPAGVVSFDYDWEYGYEYAVVVSEDTPVFSSWQTEFLTNWSASHAGTVLAPNKDIQLYRSVRSETYALSVADILTYHPLWLSDDGFRPYAKGDTTLNTDWLFYIAETASYDIQCAGDDTYTMDLHRSDASGALGALVQNVTITAKPWRKTVTMNLAAGWYRIVGTVWNHYKASEEGNYGKNPGYWGTRITYTDTSKYRRKLSTAVTALFEKYATEIDNVIRMQVGNVEVAFNRDGGLPDQGKVTIFSKNTEATIHSIYRRRARLTKYPALRSNTWLRLSGDLLQRFYQGNAPRGYEYWAITDGRELFNTHMMQFLKKWRTERVDGITYDRTYCFTEPHAPYSLWASKDGLTVDLINQSASIAIFEVTAPVTGTYTVQAWGNDAPRFAIYEGPYVGDDGTFDAGNGNWGQYKRVWWWGRSNDDNYVRSTLGMVAGQSYVMYLYCKNKNGGNAYLSMRILLPESHIAYQDNGYDAGSVYASHVILPTSQMISAPEGDVTDYYDGVSVNYSDSKVTSISGLLTKQWPSLVAVYQRPIYTSSGDSDLGGWHLEYSAPTMADAVKTLANNMQKDRDYFFLLRQISTDVPYADASGNVVFRDTDIMLPIRFLNSSHAYDITPQISRITAERYRRMIELDGGSMVARDMAEAVAYVISRPCKVNT